MNKGIALLIVMLLHTSCEWLTNHEEDDPPETSGTVLVESTIGSSGGIIEAEGIRLTISEGTFDSDFDLKILSSDMTESEFEENQCTDIFLVEGIPENFKKPIGITMKHRGDLAQENYVAVGRKLYISEMEDSVTSYRLFDASETSGYLVTLLEPELDILEDPYSTTLKGTQSKINLPLVLVGSSWMLKYKADYFSIIYPMDATSGNITKLVEFMDEAVDSLYQMFQADRKHMKEVFAIVGNPKVVVLNKKLSNPHGYGSHIWLPRITWSMPWAAGWVNASEIAYNISLDVLENCSDAELKACAYMWVFRTFTFAFYGDKLDWFSYGSCLWITEKYSDQVNYSSSVYPKVGQSPFTGIQEGMHKYPGDIPKSSILGGEITDQEKSHALGMVPLFKYLESAYPEDKSLFRRIIDATVSHNSKYPVEGFVEAIQDPEYVWWHGFYKEFLSGNIYDLPADVILEPLKISDQIDFYEESDTSMYVDENYADLSAKLYKINFLFPEFSNEAQLNLKIVPKSLNLNYVTAMAFGVKNNKLEYLGHGNDLTINNLKELKENDYNSLIVAVINSANEAPYNENLNIELECTFESSLPQTDFIWANLSVWTLAESRSTGNNIRYSYYSSKLPGEANNNRFVATWNNNFDGTNYKGTYTIDFDPVSYPSVITGFSMTESKWYNYSDGSISDTTTYTIYGGNLEFAVSAVYASITYDYIAESGEACNIIDYQNYEDSGRDDNPVFTGFPICDGESYIAISLGKVPPPSWSSSR